MTMHLPGSVMIRKLKSISIKSMRGLARFTLNLMAMLKNIFRPVDFILAAA